MCNYPLLQLHITNTDKTVGIATQKGLFFKYNDIIFGRDGCVGFAKKATESYGCNIIKYMFLTRLMALYDIFQFLIFGTLTLVATILISIAALISGLVLTFGVCSDKVITLWYVSWNMFYGCCGSILAYLILYILLPFQLLIPEILFMDLKIHTLGYCVDETLPV